MLFRSPRLFKFRVAPLPDEVVTQNNVRESLINVRDVREKILYFEGEPRYEYKFIRRAIPENDNVIVTGLVRTADNKYLRQGVDTPDELVAAFPKTREELFSYRSLIIGSLEAAALTGDQLRMINDFVDRRGGGLLMLGGPRSFAEGGYAGTAVADVLPVVIDRTKVMAKGTVARLNVKPTRAGLATAVTQLAGTEAASADRWNTLPPITTVNRVDEVKPGATVLLTGTDEQRAERPMLVFERYGRGKTFAFLPQDSWQWQMHASIPLEDQTHEQFWRQLLRWTCRMADVQVFSSRSTLHSLQAALGPHRQPWQEVLLNPAPALSPLLPVIDQHSAHTETVPLGFVGRLSSEKRPERLLHMLALLPDHHLTLEIGRAHV